MAFTAQLRDQVGSTRLASKQAHAFALLLSDVQADWFKQYQQSATEQVKGQLRSHWLPKCLDVFRRLPPVPINGDTESYFRCACLSFCMFGAVPQYCLRLSQPQMILSTAAEPCGCLVPCVQVCSCPSKQSAAWFGEQHPPRLPSILQAAQGSA